MGKKASGTWSNVNTIGIKPTRRWGHKMVIFNNVLYLIGGRDAVANTNDLYEFHFGTSFFLSPPFSFPLPLPSPSLLLLSSSPPLYFFLLPFPLALLPLSPFSLCSLFLSPLSTSSFSFPLYRSLACRVIPLSGIQICLFLTSSLNLFD